MKCPNCSVDVVPIAWYTEDGDEGWLCKACRANLDSNQVERFLDTEMQAAIEAQKPALTALPSADTSFVPYTEFNRVVKNVENSFTELAKALNEVIARLNKHDADRIMEKL